MRAVILLLALAVGCGRGEETKATPRPRTASSLAAVTVASLETSHVAIGARPSLSTDGVDITGWKNFLPHKDTPLAAVLFMKGDGTERTLSSPSGESDGVELWAYIAEGSGSSDWDLAGYLDGGATIVVPANGCAIRQIQYLGGTATRLAIASTPSAGAPTYFLQPQSLTEE